jgi:hypothetical protein
MLTAKHNKASRKPYSGLPALSAGTFNSILFGTVNPKPNPNSKP